AWIDPKPASRFPLAQTIYHHRLAHPRIQFHSLHPPPFAVIRKGLSLTDSYSGATRHSGRFSEGLLLRRSHRVMLKFGLVRSIIVLRSLLGRAPTLWPKNHVPPSTDRYGVQIMDFRLVIGTGLAGAIGKDRRSPAPETIVPMATRTVMH
ncbi:MAG: hypothetical protein VCE74_08195, partial [Alphaproteobacteria bacterium]